jgi:hypothetical protein
MRKETTERQKYKATDYTENASPVFFIRTKAGKNQPEENSRWFQRMSFIIGGSIPQMNDAILHICFSKGLITYDTF